MNIANATSWQNTFSRVFELLNTTTTESAAVWYIDLYHFKITDEEYLIVVNAN